MLYVKDTDGLFDWRKDLEAINHILDNFERNIKRQTEIIERLNEIQEVVN